MIVRLLAWFFQVLPRSWALALARALGLFWYYVIPVRRRVMLLNLRLAFPRKPLAELHRICRRTMVNFVKTFVEFGRLHDVDDDFLRKHIRLHGRKDLEKAFSLGRGVVVASGHFGNWEVMGAVTTRLGFPITYIVKKVKDPRVDDLINGWRREQGIEIIYSREAAQSIPRHLERGRLVAFMIDQDAGKRGVMVEFFGHPASTPKGAAAYALKYGAPVLLAWSLRRRDNSHDIYYRLVELDPVSQVNTETITTALEKLTRELETVVAATPDQYMWMHHRWRTYLKSLSRHGG
jgi:KDO2-lipid IV(A) lauroyltransferase